MTAGWRSIVAALGVALVSACRHAPTAPDPSNVPVPVGLVILRVSPQFPCSPAGGGPAVFPEVRTRINLTGNGITWSGTSASVPGGDVALQFHVTTASPAGTFVGGTIKGTAVHMPELIAAPPWDARVSFGTGGGTIAGVVFAAGGLATTNGLDGTGSGAVTLSDSNGRSCSGATFSWSVFPPP